MQKDYTKAPTTNLPMPSEIAGREDLTKVQRTVETRAYLRSTLELNGTMRPLLGYLQPGGHYGSRRLDTPSAILYVYNLVQKDKMAPGWIRDIVPDLWWEHIVSVTKKLGYKWERGMIVGLQDKVSFRLQNPVEDDEGNEGLGDEDEG